jgi:hypothetical protein
LRQSRGKHRQRGVAALPAGCKALAAQIIRSRVDAASRERRRGSRTAEELVGEAVDRIGDVDHVRVVRVRSVQARKRWAPEKEVTERGDGVGDVDSTVGVRVASSKRERPLEER